MKQILRAIFMWFIFVQTFGNRCESTQEGSCYPGRCREETQLCDCSNNVVSLTGPDCLELVTPLPYSCQVRFLRSDLSIQDIQNCTGMQYQRIPGLCDYCVPLYTDAPYFYVEWSITVPYFRRFTSQQGASANLTLYSRFRFSMARFSYPALYHTYQSTYVNCHVIADNNVCNFRTSYVGHVSFHTHMFRFRFNVFGARYVNGQREPFRPYYVYPSYVVSVVGGLRSVPLHCLALGNCTRHPVTNLVPENIVTSNTFQPKLAFANDFSPIPTKVEYILYKLGGSGNLTEQRPSLLESGNLDTISFPKLTFRNGDGVYSLWIKTKQPNANPNTIGIIRQLIVVDRRSPAEAIHVNREIEIKWTRLDKIVQFDWSKRYSDSLIEPLKAVDKGPKDLIGQENLPFALDGPVNAYRNRNAVAHVNGIVKFEVTAQIVWMNGAASTSQPLFKVESGNDPSNPEAFTTGFAKLSRVVVGDIYEVKLSALNVAGKQLNETIHIYVDNSPPSMSQPTFEMETKEALVFKFNGNDPESFVKDVGFRISIGSSTISRTSPVPRFDQKRNCESTGSPGSCECNPFTRKCYKTSFVVAIPLCLLVPAGISNDTIKIEIFVRSNANQEANRTIVIPKETRTSLRQLIDLNAKLVVSKKSDKFLRFQVLLGENSATPPATSRCLENSFLSITIKRADNGEKIQPTEMRQFDTSYPERPYVFNTESCTEYDIDFRFYYVDKTAKTVFERENRFLAMLPDVKQVTDRVSSDCPFPVWAVPIIVIAVIVVFVIVVFVVCKRRRPPSYSTATSMQQHRFDPKGSPRNPLPNATALSATPFSTEQSHNPPQYNPGWPNYTKPTPNPNTNYVSPKSTLDPYISPYYGPADFPEVMAEYDNMPNDSSGRKSINSNAVQLKASYNDQGVAVKKLNSKATPTDEKLMLDKAKYAAVVPSHQHVLDYLGVVWDKLWIVMELGQHTLFDYLVQNRSLNNYSLGLFCKQVASGLTFLHEQVDPLTGQKGIVHKRLYSGNVLVMMSNGSSCLKIYGFGPHYNWNSVSEQARSKMIPFRVMAPEAMTGGQHTTASDVWSLGVTFWEIWSYPVNPKVRPLQDCSSISAAAAHLGSGKRLGRPKRCPNSLFELMELCWKTDPSQRPTTDYVLNHCGL